MQALEEEYRRQSTALQRYFHWLRSLPVTDASSSDAGSAGAASPSQAAADRLRLFEGTVLRLADDVRRVRASFLADTDRARTLIAARCVARSSTTAIAGTYNPLHDHSDAQAEAASKELAASQEEVERVRQQLRAQSTRHEHALAAASMGSDAGGVSSTAASAAARAEWKHHVDRRTQRSYWHNARTNATQWERPSELESAEDRVRRKELAACVETYREQQGRLFAAVTTQLQRQVGEIVSRAGLAGDIASLVEELVAETSRYHQETLAALNREVSMLAASMSLR